MYIYIYIKVRTKHIEKYNNKNENDGQFLTVEMSKTKSMVFANVVFLGSARSYYYYYSTTSTAFFFFFSFFLIIIITFLYSYFSVHREEPRAPCGGGLLKRYSAA